MFQSLEKKRGALGGEGGAEGVMVLSDFFAVRS